MLIKGILPVISPERQNRGFVFSYKSTTYVIDLAGRPWPVRKR
jgi:hypothetical protein